MILVETSVLVDALSGRRSSAVALLVRLVDDAEWMLVACQKSAAGLSDSGPGGSPR